MTKKQNDYTIFTWIGLGLRSNFPRTRVVQENWIKPNSSWKGHRRYCISWFKRCVTYILGFYLTNLVSVLKQLLLSVAVHELTVPPSVERKFTSDPSLVSIFKIISVRRKKGFWTWSKKMLIFRKMRRDIWRRNIFQGVEIIELYLWLKKLR